MKPYVFRLLHLLSLNNTAPSLLHASPTAVPYGRPARDPLPSVPASAFSVRSNPSVPSTATYDLSTRSTPSPPSEPTATCCSQKTSAPESLAPDRHCPAEDQQPSVGRFPQQLDFNLHHQRKYNSHCAKKPDAEAKPSRRSKRTLSSSPLTSSALVSCRPGSTRLRLTRGRWPLTK
jgi:hypothetical protein